MKSNAEIRTAARAQLGGSLFSELWLYGLAFCLIQGLIISFTSSFFFGILLVGPLTFSLNYAFLALARGKGKFDFADLLQGFNNGQFVRTFLASLLVGVFTLLWSLLFVIPGIIKAYSYRLTLYVAADHPELSPTECITESRRLMDGNKWRFFCMDVVMVLWSLLGSCVCGVGALWVTPYQAAADANLYEEIVAAKATV